MSVVDLEVGGRENGARCLNWMPSHSFQAGVPIVMNGRGRVQAWVLLDRGA